MKNTIKKLLVGISLAASLCVVAQDQIGITFTKPGDWPSGVPMTYQVAITNALAGFKTNFTVNAGTATSITNMFPSNYFPLGTNHVWVRLVQPIAGGSSLISDAAKVQIIKTTAPAVQVIELSVITRLPGQPWVELQKLPDVTVPRTSSKQEFAVIAQPK